MGCHFLLQEIFLPQGLNPGLPHCRQMIYCLSPQGSLKLQSCAYKAKPVTFLFSFHQSNYKCFLMPSLGISKKAHAIFQVESAAAAAKSLQSCSTLCGPIGSSPPGSPVPGILQARTLHACSVAQSCPTLCDPMDYRSPSSFCPWDYPGKNTGVGCHFLLQGIFPAQRSN